MVEFLAACGLETMRGGNQRSYFDRARAGLEHTLVAAADLPYVVKDPWLFAYCEAVDLEAIAVDVLILPMRDLTAAATSRVLQERIGLLESQPNRAVPQVYTQTPGGSLQSLDVTDQERLLAVGFHELLRWAVSEGLPVVLLDFPRFVEDSSYLITALSPWLLDHCDAATAGVAFDRVADPTRIRVKIGEDDGGSAAIALPSDNRPSAEDLDRKALAALVVELKNQVWQANIQVENQQRLTADLRQDRLTLSLRLARAAEDQMVMKEALAATRHASIRLGAAETSLVTAESRLVMLRGRLDDTRRRVRRNRVKLAETRQELADTRAKIQEIYASPSWRLSRPVRAFGRGRKKTPRMAPKLGVQPED